MSNGIQYLSGDATAPVSQGICIIAHICNDIGAWGRGFVLSLSKRWPKAEESYRNWYNGISGKPFVLGETDFVTVSGGNIIVANMIAQHGLRSASNPVPVDYGSLKLCLAAVRHEARNLGASVHMPRIGTGLAGGDWSKIEQVIEFELIGKGIPTYVYSLPPKADAM